MTPEKMAALQAKKAASKRKEADKRKPDKGKGLPVNTRGRGYADPR